MTNVLILGAPMHGIPASECVEPIREAFPHFDVRVGTTPNEQREYIADAQVVVGGHIDESLLDHAPNLELFASIFAGADHLPLDQFAADGVAVTTAAGVHGPNIAEHVLGWWFMVTRRLDEGLRRQKRREWRHFQAMGEFDGSRVCIVGLGEIGQAIVQRLAGFDVETVGVRYTPEKGGPTDAVYGFDEITDALVDTDYVAIACPLTETTRGLIGHDEFVAMSHEAIFVNVGRGPIVETDDLVRALRRGDIHAACLDVTDPEPLPADHPLWSLGNAYITPHNAGHTPHYWDRVAEILIENLTRVEETGEWTGLRNQVV